MNSPVQVAGLLDYPSIIAGIEPLSPIQLSAWLFENLPYFWREAYKKMTMRQTDIVRVQYITFEYFYDHYPEMQPASIAPSDLGIEPRLMGVLGYSAPQLEQRDDYRLKGWVGPTEKHFGKRWDKGHFIAHSLGGAVDGTEINVFVQSRRLNRGWSTAGKWFRQMETYCASNPGTFCFSRPLYIDQTAKPAFIEFGLLKPTDELWVECFDNR